MERKQRIIVSDSRVGVIREGQAAPAWECQWGEVREIVAWKVDALVYDIICIGFRVSDEPRYLRTDEEVEGWDALMSALEQQYGFHPSDWWSRVAFPAFQENWTVLWSKRDGAGQDPTHLK